MRKRRSLGQLAVMMLVGFVAFGVGNGGLERAWRLGGQGHVSRLGKVCRLGEALISPAVAEAATLPKKKKSGHAKPTVVVKKKVLVKKAKKTKSLKAVTHPRQPRVVKTTCLRCEPQSLTYARQRSGIMTSRNGTDNGPLTWFASERAAGRATNSPVAGSVLILGGQGHGMPTGHVAYVEKVVRESPSTYRLVFSHTNYDRRCHLETDIEAIYHQDAMTLDIMEGAWKDWGRGLKVAGFIQDQPEG